MLSRVAAVMAPRTHNRRRVTGSSGRRREGGESEPQRPNMSRRVFTSALLLLLVVMMCCGTGGAAQAAGQASGPSYKWKDVKDEEGGGVTVDSLGVPGLLKVGSDVFAVAEAQCKRKDENSGFNGIASQIITMDKDNEPKELLEDDKDTQVLEEVTSGKEKMRVDVSRPTTVVEGNDIYMLVGKNSGENLAECKATTDTIKSGILLVKGKVGEGGNKRIHWKETDGLPCTLGEHHNTLKRLIGGGGSGVKLKDSTLVFPVEATKTTKDVAQKDGKTVSLLLYSSDTKNWKLSKGMSDGGCSDPSVVEWGKDKLMMMTVCDDGRRVYESGDKGDSWTEALGTLSRVWGNKQDKKVKAVRSGFITATIDGVEDNRNVMLVTLPVYSEVTEKGGNVKKGKLHLWLTDNTHIVDIGPVSDDDAAASSLLYKSGKDGEANKKDELIALYEKKKGDEGKPSPGMVSVLLTAQLQRVKEVLATWKKADDIVSKLCTSESVEKDASTEDACSPTVKITAGLVGFLSGNFSENTWRDEYLGVNATVKKENGDGETGATKTSDGVQFHGAWAEWPVGSQGENQLYHFANYNFTLVATVSIDGEPTSGSVPVMGVRLSREGEKKTFDLSYDKEKKWQVLCDVESPEDQSRTLATDTTHHVVILLRNGTQGSA
ncbi:putative trans-sialidase [Trypanosoma cruzi]|uniref:Trans-sialidase, putative n=1 Tax=Trypanosoma cruzi (strain CL Brener) TaxID=353153 RepID=Q4E106_TRYCC|nr:trans-sialidase, putative [Trypanosoma cruzi]EAN98449.1 trans-sialidase, putative [Trypanosoma cruzi]RNC34144.1 putative trans-sialidase [Trypanosoma cruzi]|eukprot:XP_820300.1 trans-sialidase [Trypanosoma cruzi strain CL Brener]